MRIKTLAPEAGATPPSQGVAKKACHVASSRARRTLVSYLSRESAPEPRRVQRTLGALGAREAARRELRRQKRREAARAEKQKQGSEAPRPQPRLASTAEVRTASVWGAKGILLPA